MKELNDKLLNLDISSSKSISLKKQMLKKDIILKKDEIEKKLFEIFPDLKDEKKFHNFFSSYDFHDNEIFMVHFWKDIIEYITVHLKEDFAINYGQDKVHGLQM